MAGSLSGRSERTVEPYRDTVRPLRERLGEVKLKDLTAGDVQEALDALTHRLSPGSLQIIRNCLERAIRHAEIRDLVGRNGASDGRFLRPDDVIEGEISGLGTERNRCVAGDLP